MIVLQSLASAFVPKGQLKIARRFNAGFGPPIALSPEGTAESPVSVITERIIYCLRLPCRTLCSLCLYGKNPCLSACRQSFAKANVHPWLNSNPIIHTPFNGIRAVWETARRIWRSHRSHGDRESGSERVNSRLFTPNNAYSSPPPPGSFFTQGQNAPVTKSSSLIQPCPT
jgi:hypothetical protein